MAAKFWIGGTGNYSDNTHWTTPSSGGANNTTAAGSGDTATFDGASGGGTVTIDQDIAVQGFTWGAFTGTIDNSANHNFTLSATTGFNGSGSGARTFTGGSGTYTCSAANSTWNMGTITNLTNPTTAFSSATVVMSGVSTGSSANTFAHGSGLVYGTVSFNANKLIVLTGSSFTIGTLNITGTNCVAFSQAATTTITNAFAWTGTSANPILITSQNPGNGPGTITTGSGTTNTAAWVGFESFTFTPVGGSILTANNSLDFGKNNTSANFTIASPTTGGTVGIIGS